LRIGSITKASSRAIGLCYEFPDILIRLLN
jgi:hypothetical protein